MRLYPPTVTAVLTIEPSVGFAPIAAGSARVLILGSLPGAMSIKQQQYYAKPQNAFWRIMGELFGACPALPYTERLEALRFAGVALWDVCASAHRNGSLDSAITSHVVNDFGEFFAQHPQLELICFNGRKAAQIYRLSVFTKLPTRMQLLPAKTLPSTSAAHAGVPYDEKLRQWIVGLRDLR